MLILNRIFIICTVFILIAFWGCRSSQDFTKPPAQQKQQQEKVGTLQAMFDTSGVFTGNFTGFMLYDPEGDSTLFALNEKKYFTPASNTKLLTFYAGLKILPVTLPGIQYAMRGDSLIFRGTGDPSFLHPDFGNLDIYKFLKDSDKQLYYTDEHFDDELLGPGWSWSDFNYYYSAEKSPFPIYGNVMRVTVEEIEQQQIAYDNDGLQVSPAFFRGKIDTPQYNREKPLIAREFFDNNYKYFPKSDTTTYTIDRPFHYTSELLTDMLKDTLGKPVAYTAVGFPDEYKTLYSIPSDTVYRRMLQPSDNFIAEQLLLVAASEMGDPLNARKVIDHMKKTHLEDMPDEPQWADGSGLSRYNMFTPRSIVWLLNEIRNEFVSDRELFHLLPAGGESGTIKSWYRNRDDGDPYIYAKTGTLSNNHSLSGYLIAKSGKVYLFSFHNNHYVSSSSTVKNEMEKILWYIHENY